jgi:hypothetical protein
LNVPAGPTKKIVADVMLSANDPAVFARSGKFIAAMDREFGTKQFPRDNYISNDLNALGPHAIAVGTPSARVSLIDGGSVMASLEKKARLIDAIHKEIGLLQATLAKEESNPGKRGRQEAQLALLYRRIARLHAESDREVVMVYLYCVYRTGATVAGWDSVAVDTRGTRGTLARAITYMPKRKGLEAEFVAWANDLKEAGLLVGFDRVVPVSPYTSQACDECFCRTGKQQRKRAPGTGYHEFRCTDLACPNHVTTGNRHEVSARVSAILLKQVIERGVDAVT